MVYACRQLSTHGSGPMFGSARRCSSAPVRCPVLLVVNDDDEVSGVDLIIVIMTGRTGVLRGLQHLGGFLTEPSVGPPPLPTSELLKATYVGTAEASDIQKFQLDLAVRR